MRSAPRSSAADRARVLLAAAARVVAPARRKFDHVGSGAAARRRQPQHEDGAGRGGVAKRDVAAMGAQHLARDGEAEAGAAGARRAGEGTEEIFARLGRQARPVIGE